MEVKQDMTVEVKRDLPLEVLANLYTIKAANEEEKAVLDYKINGSKKRLEVLRVKSLADIRPYIVDRRKGGLATA